MIEKKMSELNPHEGYPIVGEEWTRVDPKGKGKAPESRPRSPSPIPPPLSREGASHFQPNGAPASFSGYSMARSPPPSYGSHLPPASTLPSLPSLPPIPPIPPIPTSSGRPSSSNASAPSRRGSRGTPSIHSRKLRPQKSREFQGGRRRSSTSTTSARRVCSADPPSRREGGIRPKGSVIFRTTEPVTRESRAAEGEDEPEEEGSVTDGDSTDSDIAPLPVPRLEPRVATSRQASSLELAQFLKETGPDLNPRQMRSASHPENHDATQSGPLTTNPSPRLPLRPLPPRLLPRPAAPSLRDEDVISPLDLAEFFRSEPPPSSRSPRSGLVPLRIQPSSLSISPRPVPRAPSQPRLRPHEISPSLELAEFLREAPPPQIAIRSPEPSPTSVQHRRTARQPGDLLASSGIGELLREISSVKPGPGSSRQDSIQAALDKLSGQSNPTSSDPHARLEARGATFRAPSEDTQSDGLSFTQMIREGGRQSRSCEEEMPSGRLSPLPSPGASPNNRHNKRWTMSGMSSIFQGRPSAPDDESRVPPLPSPTPGTPHPHSSSDLDLPRRSTNTRENGRPNMPRDEGMTSGRLSPLPTPPPPASPSNRHGKRWTMGGMSSLFVPRPSVHLEDSSRAPPLPSPTPGPAARRSSSDLPRHSAPHDRDEPFSDALPVPPMTAPLASTPLPPHDFKNRPDPLEGREVPSAVTPSTPMFQNQGTFPPGVSLLSLPVVRFQWS